MFRFELVAAMLTMILSIPPPTSKGSLVIVTPLPLRSCLMTFLPQSIAVHHRISYFLVNRTIPQYLQLHNLLKSPNQ